MLCFSRPRLFDARKWFCVEHVKLQRRFSCNRCTWIHWLQGSSSAPCSTHSNDSPLQVFLQLLRDVVMIAVAAFYSGFSSTRCCYLAKNHDALENVGRGTGMLCSSVHWLKNLFPRFIRIIFWGYDPWINFAYRLND
jgi:hypothetical protein